MGVPQLNEKESAETTANLCIKLFTAMGITDVSLQDIDIAHSNRPSQNSNPIICKFVRRLAKEKIMAAREKIISRPNSLVLKWPILQLHELSCLTI